MKNQYIVLFFLQITYQEKETFVNDMFHIIQPHESQSVFILFLPQDSEHKKSQIKTNHENHGIQDLGSVKNIDT